MLNTTYKIDFFGISDRGLVREQNEDAWGAALENNLFVLADGMGGHNAGEVASKEAVEYLLSHFTEFEGDTSVERLKTMVEKTNRRIYEKGEENKELSGMGTTLCCLYFAKEWAHFAHVGDSRIYLLRDHGLKQITQDHSLVNELIQLGTMTEQEAEVFPFKHTLTKALGTSPAVEPSIDSIEIQEGDLFILASDGLTNFLKNSEIEKVLNEENRLETAAAHLVERANANGGGDNITLLLIKIVK